MWYLIALIPVLLFVCVITLMHATKNYEYDFLESDQ